MKTNKKEKKKLKKGGLSNNLGSLNSISMGQSLKLKIRIGPQSISTENYNIPSDPESDFEQIETTFQPDLSYLIEEEVADVPIYNFSDKDILYFDMPQNEIDVTSMGDEEIRTFSETGNIDQIMNFSEDGNTDVISTYSENQKIVELMKTISESGNADDISDFEEDDDLDRDINSDASENDNGAGDKLSVKNDSIESEEEIEEENKEDYSKSSITNEDCFIDKTNRLNFNNILNENLNVSDCNNYSINNKKNTNYKLDNSISRINKSNFNKIYNIKNSSTNNLHKLNNLKYNGSMFEERSNIGVINSDLGSNHRSNDLIDEDLDDNQWLDALESGELDENGCIKKKKPTSISLLTARQRVILHGEKIEEPCQLPAPIGPVKLTAEQQMKHLKKTLRRRELAEEKTEKDKQETLDKLLKKQDTKLKINKNCSKKNISSETHMFRYLNNSSGIEISIPNGYDSPLISQKSYIPKAAMQCIVESCTNLKKYNCSKTNLPLCSLECYKKNYENMLQKQTISIKT